MKKEKKTDENIYCTSRSFLANIGWCAEDEFDRRQSDMKHGRNKELNQHRKIQRHHKENWLFQLQHRITYYIFD